jgi:ribosomal protein S6E (S10)
MRLRVSASVRQCVIATNVGAYTSTQRGERKKKKACGVPAGSAVDAAVGDPRAAGQRFKEAFE